MAFSRALHNSLNISLSPNLFSTTTNSCFYSTHV